MPSRRRSRKPGSDFARSQYNCPFTGNLQEGAPHLVSLLQLEGLTLVPTKFYRSRQVKAALAGASDATVLKMAERGEIPKPVKFGPRNSHLLWPAAEFDAAIAKKIEEAQKT